MASNSQVESRSKRELARQVDLSAIQSFEDAIRMLAAEGVQAVDSTEYGDGFTLLKDKNSLVGKTFVIVDATLYDGDFGDQFAVLYVVTQDGKFVVTDGSTGIRDQVKRLGDNAIGVVCREGLVRSDYTVDLPDPKTGEMKPTPATTYYLSGVR